MREIYHSRRGAWFAQNGPCVVCRSWDDLELDHTNPSMKIGHNVWSWSLERREKELSKCQALCHECHKDKTRSEVVTCPPHGTRARYKHSLLPCRCEECTGAHRRYCDERRMITGRNSTFYDRRRRLVAPEGFEPSSPGSEPGILPLDDRATVLTRMPATHPRIKL